MTVAILGAGWIGQPLGRVLAEAGHTVHAATTTPEKLAAIRKAGLRPFLVAASPDGIEGSEVARFFEADALVITLPPGRGTPGVEERYGGTMERIYGAATAIPHAVFTSSTSVYPDLGGAPVVTEAEAGHARDERLRASARAIVAEEAWLPDTFRTASILRLAGLYGPGRSPTRYLAGRSDLSGGNRPVNLVHRDDVVAAIQRVLDDRIAGTFNLAADEHPTRRDYHTAAARALGLVPPVFAPDSSPVVGKRVSNARAKDVLGATFRPLDPARHAEDTAA
ncbi:MAG: 2-dehydropantoate 2-reductase N-terminal domain-containing protein [Bacteroidota bacterium]